MLLEVEKARLPEERDRASVPPQGRAVLQRAAGTGCWTHRSEVRTQLD
jgi:hypothetical protein